MRRDVQERLSEIRRQMLAALQQNDRAKYERFGAEHRRILHAASAETERACEKALAAIDTVA
jgi:HSP90 family molecular chaperone